MIIEYHRPKSLDVAIELISRTNPNTVPLGGGTVLSRSLPDPIAVVDLQSLGLDTIEKQGTIYQIGATATLQRLMEDENIPTALKSAIRYEATYNIRQTATVAGTIVTSNGRSPFATVMLSLDTQLVLMPRQETIKLGDFFAIGDESIKGKVITKIIFPLNIQLAYRYVARTPADLPIVCVSVTKWSSGRTRVALGGFGVRPMFVFDGPDASGALIASRNAYLNADDVWASGEYRSDVASKLTQRCLNDLH